MIPHLAPQPIPYQGSKRRIASLILPYFPKDTRRLWEPFVGSGAITLAAAVAGRAEQFVVGDSLEPLVGIWQKILEDPTGLSEGYAQIWQAQLADPRGYYDQVRSAYNQDKDPIKLLYLIARCVKNAVRFNSEGAFNQAPDRRRLGMRPATLKSRVEAVHQLLQGRTGLSCGDYALALAKAEPEDIVYLDPPYMGVSGRRDARYHQGLDLDRFVEELAEANRRKLSVLVSFDGHCGGRSYGPGLPDTLDLTRMELAAGLSAQATLNGRQEQTVESLYLSPALRRRLSEGRTV